MDPWGEDGSEGEAGGIQTTAGGADSIRINEDQAREEALSDNEERRTNDRGLIGLFDDEEDEGPEPSPQPPAELDEDFVEGDEDGPERVTSIKRAREEEDADFDVEQMEEDDDGDYDDANERPTKRARTEPQEDVEVSDQVPEDDQQGQEENPNSNLDAKSAIDRDRELSELFKKEVLEKAKRPRKTRIVRRARRGGNDDDEEVFDLDTDVLAEGDETLQMVQAMEAALDDDTRSSDSGRPALAKLQLLPALRTFLSKRFVQQGRFEPSLLRVLKEWLMPNERSQLPSLNIRTAILKALDKMALDQDLLMSSQIGRPVMLLLAHPGETGENKRICQRLVQRWSEPIFSSNVKPHTPAESSRSVSRTPSRGTGDSTRQRPRAQSLDLALSRAQTTKEREVVSRQKIGTYYSIIPPKANLDFAKRPPSKIDISRERRQSESKPKSRLEMPKRRASTGVAGSARAATVSVTSIGRR